MHAGILPLLGALTVGSPPAPPATPATPGVAVVSGTTYPGPNTARPGVLPVPSMGPPGAVAAFGAMPPPGERPHATAPAIPAPLTAAKFLMPEGVRVTAFPGSELARIYQAGSVFGLRPGYVYRFELTNLPYDPEGSLFPEVEVRGMLVPRPGMKYMEYPIPLTFSQADIARAQAGALVTKVIYLEDPKKAVPAVVSADAPIEIPEDSEKLALEAARENGRLMAIVRLGNRRPSPEELNAVAIDGTILMPGEQRLRAPARPPVFPFWGVPMFDPILGPRGPAEECFVNGDDKDDPLGIGPGGALGGLNPTDVGVEYTMGGKRQIATSCMVCICSPRYAIRRAELIPNGFDVSLGLKGSHGRSRPSGFIDRQFVVTDIGREKPVEAIGHTRPKGYVGQIGLSVFIGTSRPSVLAQVEGVKVEGIYVEPVQLTAYPTLCPLTVTKTVDPTGPKQPGDVVTITIRYANTGAKAASDLVVSDSLSGRLEYIPGSAQTDRPANFTAYDNEVGSLILRWELPGTLLPGQSGTIKFKARVR